MSVQSAGEHSASKVAAIMSTLLSGIEAEGLTATTLQDALAKLDIRREEVLMTLYAAASETYSSRLHEDNAALDDESLASDVACSTALAALRDQALVDDEAALQLAELASQDAGLVASLQQSRQQVAGVRLAAELQHRLAEFDAHVQRGAFSEAAWIAVELQKAAAAGHSAETAEAELNARVDPLRQHLIAVAPQYLEVDPSSHVPTLLRPADQTAAALVEILRAAQVLGVQPEVLNGLSAFCVHYCVLPILYAEQQQQQYAGGFGGGLGGGLAPHGQLPGASPATSIASSALSAATAFGDARVGTEKSLYKTFKVLCDQVLQGDTDLISSIGPIFWPAVSKAYIAVKLKPLRPQTDAELESFSRRGMLGQKLEQKAVKLGLLGSDADGPIARYVRQAIGRVLNSRRARFVAAARDLMISPASHETVTVTAGVPRRTGASRALFDDPHLAAQQAQHDPAFAVLEGQAAIMDAGPCLVSKAGEGVVSAMQEALSEALRAGSPAMAQAMCAAVVDMAAITIAVPPAPAPTSTSTAGTAAEHAHHEEALLLPYPASVRYNDLHYVYTTLCVLPYLFSPRLQQLVHPNVNFVSAAGRVKHAADDVLNAMVDRQRQELLAIASEFKRFRGMNGPGDIKCKKAVMQLLHAFRRLGSVLRGVLTPIKLTEVAGVLMEAVCASTCDIILGMGDISMDESEQIPVILGDLITGMHDTLLSAVTSSGDDTTSAEQAGDIEQRCRELLVRFNPSLEKLKDICWILNARMQEIIDRWRSGRLSAVGFSAGEVSVLVKAIFEDTHLRKDVLRELKEGRRVPVAEPQPQTKEQQATAPAPRLAASVAPVHVAARGAAPQRMMQAPPKAPPAAAAPRLQAVPVTGPVAVRVPKHQEPVARQQPAPAAAADDDGWGQEW